jgi:chorismate synthase
VEKRPKNVYIFPLQAQSRGGVLRKEEHVPGNSFGEYFRITTFGESHGEGIGVVLDGVPPGITLEETDIQRELDRRRPGQSGVTTQRREEDIVHLLSGTFEKKTTGTPIALFIDNRDVRSEDYTALRDLFRPGHADYTYFAKYGIRDWRGSGRASGRETAARVAAGAVAKKILAARSIEITAYAVEIGGFAATRRDIDVVEKNEVRTPDMEAAGEMARLIGEAKEAGDSLGGVVEALAVGVPAGLGDPVFLKLEAELARAVMSIGAVRSFEIGAGMGAARMRGSEYNDEIFAQGRRIRMRSNNAGGVIGGISTGETIICRMAVRPPASISVPQKTVDVKGREREITVEGRHDPCIVPRIVPVVEAMIALVLLDRLIAQIGLSSLVDP